MVQVNTPVTENTGDYVTLEVAKERDRQFYNSCIIPEKQPLQVDWFVGRLGG